MTPQPSNSPPESHRHERRRTHRKSRNGCIICKKRRVKCDEGQPQCQNCIFGQRPCSYQSKDSKKTRSQSTDGAAHTPTSAVVENDPRAIVLGDQGTYSALHMSLLHHAETHSAFFMALQGAIGPVIDIAVDSAPTAPYVLDQFLALSALHLATLKPGSAQVYHHQATELQTRALGLFNKIRDDVSESNYLCPFLFATFLGLHVLRETLANQQGQPLSEFIDAFVSYVRLHRGVRAVTSQYWGRILESELQPLMYITKCMDQVDKLAPGTETDELRMFLREKTDLSTSSIDASLSGLKWIQWALDIAALEPSRNDLAVHAIMAWPVMIPDQYLDRLYQRQPEALTVLAHYAAILHRYQDFWVFGDSGSRLIQSIASSIGPFWEPALAWPCRVLAER